MGRGARSRFSRPRPLPGALARGGQTGNGGGGPGYPNTCISKNRHDTIILANVGITPANVEFSLCFAP